MNNEFRIRLEKELRRIAEQLLDDADWNEALPWQTLTTDGNGNYSWERGEGLYSGASGIALFLLETGRYTGERHYTDAAEKAIMAILEECYQKPSVYYPFITGRMSVSYVALRFYERTKKQEYLSQALALVHGCREFLTAHSADDFINGTSGTLLGLLLLHETSGEKWLLDYANAYIEHLIQKAHSGSQGLYWDRTHRQIRGLCGFSHGASGIGFVFAEAAKYLGNNALNYIAEQAYLYEAAYYHAPAGNWADFRKGIYRDQDQKEHEENYRSGNMEFFTQGGYMNAWCHGAAGIGLSRVRATQLFSDPVYRTEADNAIAQTYKNNVASHSIEGNFSLCHGGGGNADLFIEAYRLWKDEKYLEYAEIVAEMALEQYELQKFYRSGFGVAVSTIEDRSLYMGSAGVGYFYLRLLDPVNTPSVQAPTLTKTVKNTSLLELPSLQFLTSSLPKLRRGILAKNFPRTLAILDQEAGKSLQAYLQQNTNNRINECADFLAFVQALLPTLPLEAQAHIETVFRLEQTRYHLEMSVESAAYLFIRGQMEHQRAQEALASANFTDTHLQFDSFARIVEISDATILLFAHALGVTEQQLSPFGAIVVSAFTEPCNVSIALGSIAEYIDHRAEEREQINTAALNQVQQLMLAGVLRVV